MSEHMTLEQFAEFNRQMAFIKKMTNQAPPPCPNCGELHQIQIRSPLDAGGALMRCRMCGHEFHHSETYI